MEPLAGLLGAAGFVLGIAADRLAVRWPEHDEEHPAGRAVDWRTAVVALVGAVALGLLVLRFGGDALALAIFGAWFVTLIIGLATDLDQRLLPDVLTLPVIPVALVYAISGSNPLVGSEVWLGRRGRAGHPGRPVPAVHPVRCRCVRAGRRQAADRRRAAGRRRARRSGCAIFALAARRGRPGRAPGDPPDRAEDVRPVRAVLHHRGAVGGPPAAVTGSQSRDQDHRPGRHSNSHAPRLGGYHAPQAGVVPGGVHSDGDSPAGVRRQTPSTGWSGPPRSKARTMTSPT